MRALSASRKFEVEAEVSCKPLCVRAWRPRISVWGDLRSARLPVKAFTARQKVRASSFTSLGRSQVGERGITTATIPAYRTRGVHTWLSHPEEAAEAVIAAAEEVA